MPNMKYILAFLFLLAYSPVVSAQGEGAQPEKLAPPAVENIESSMKAAVSKAFGVSVEKEDGGEEEGPVFVEPEERQVVTLMDKEGIMHDYKVSVVRTREDMGNGLMWRKHMPHDVGMLFVFQDTAIRAFYMKNTYIPLDMLFLDKDGKILHIHENAVPLDETRIYSVYPTHMVLELNAGQADKLGLKAGKMVEGGWVHK